MIRSGWNEDGDGDVLALLERGRSHYASGDPSAAARYLAQVAAAAPTNRAVLMELALALFRSAALKPAEDVLLKLIELDPSDAYARRLLGSTLVRQSRHAEALPHLRLAAAMTGDLAVAAEVARAEERAAGRRVA
jgi:Flp pilus assembly protein TadD